MLVYGDRVREEKAGDVAAGIAACLARVAALPAGLARHAELVAIFIRTAELAQGLADARFAARGMDERDPESDAANRLLYELAGMVGRSWDSGFCSQALPAGWLHRLDRLATPERIAVKDAEGHAFYALYPEAYWAAARASRLGPGTGVIGIRSIGTGLAAMVAAALGAPPAVTLRPMGHPFQRRVRIGSALSRSLKAGPGPIAIADEGPGLSGSSFFSVADWLGEAGFGPERVHFFPSHAGPPGAEASPSHRASWARASKHVIGFDDLVVHASTPPHRLEHWIAGAVGKLDAPLRDISGGAWRAVCHGDERDWPPADPALEKRKVLAEAGGRRWLVKFAGLGAMAERKQGVQAHLADQGLAVKPAALVHGFTVEPWIAASPLADAPAGPDILAHLARYLALRVTLPADAPGADPAALFAMAAHNLGAHFGGDAARRIGRALGDPDRLALRPCNSDNRMHRWEWLAQGDGRLVKTDAVDHARAHDLVGCQDIAWDIAGAGVEFGLDRATTMVLAREVGARARRPVSAPLLSAMTLCYLGFQIGLWSMALARQPDEGGRIAPLLKRYAGHPALDMLRA